MLYWLCIHVVGDIETAKKNFTPSFSNRTHFKLVGEHFKRFKKLYTADTRYVIYQFLKYNTYTTVYSQEIKLIFIAYIYFLKWHTALFNTSWHLKEADVRAVMQKCALLKE